MALLLAPFAYLGLVAIEAPFFGESRELNHLPENSRFRNVALPPPSDQRQRHESGAHDQADDYRIAHFPSYPCEPVPLPRGMSASALTEATYRRRHSRTLARLS